MFEAIRANQRRSLWLISLMGVVLILLGGLLGLTVGMFVGDYHHAASLYHAVGSMEGSPRMIEPPGFWEQVWQARDGIYFGVAGATGLWFILWLAAVTGGDGILLRSARAHEIRKEDAPQLWNIVEEMTIASGLGKMPRIFIIDDSSLNAFAVGHNPDKAAVAVTAGLLKRLNRDELQGVIAHELGHIRNQDVKFMTIAGVMVGAIVLLSQVFLRAMLYSGGSRRRSSSRGGGQAAVIILVVTILIAILAPIAAQILYFACSRRREYLADASGARFTRYPPGLANALEKISRNPGMTGKDANKVVAPMYIINPLQSRSAFSLFSTHPPLEKRITILRNMAGAGFAAYEEAFRKAEGGGHCIGSRTLQAADEAAIRQPSREEQQKQEAVERAQKVENMLDRVLPLMILPCACGVKMKLPPEFKKDAVKCPRCGRMHSVSKEAIKPGQKARPAAAPARPQEPMRYRRKGSGWESFQCGACGHPIQLSPQFTAKSITCPKCDARIEVVS